MMSEKLRASVVGDPLEAQHVSYRALHIKPAPMGIEFTLQPIQTWGCQARLQFCLSTYSANFFMPMGFSPAGSPRAAAMPPRK